MAGTKLLVARGDFRGFPQFCATCLFTNDLQYRAIKASGSLLADSFQTEIAVCSDCRRRLRWLHPFGTSVLLIAVIWLNYKLDHLHVAHPIAFLLVLLPVVHSCAVQALEHLVRVRAKRRDKLEFWFANHEYAHPVSTATRCVADNSELAPVL